MSFWNSRYVHDVGTDLPMLVFLPSNGFRFLEVVAVRVPRWVRAKLEDEAQKKGEQLGTLLRRRLENLFEED